MILDLILADNLYTTVYSLWERWLQLGMRLLKKNVSWIIRALTLLVIKSSICDVRKLRVVTNYKGYISLFCCRRLKLPYWPVKLFDFIAICQQEWYNWRESQATMWRQQKWAVKNVFSSLQPLMTTWSTESKLDWNKSTDSGRV